MLKKESTNFKQVLEQITCSA